MKEEKQKNTGSNKSETFTEDTKSKWHFKGKTVKGEIANKMDTNFDIYQASHFVTLHVQKNTIYS